MMKKDDNFIVYPYERVDDLQRGGLYIIQNPEWFCFGMDAVLLSAFAKIKRGERVLDLCTGTGIIPFLLKARSDEGNYVGLEIQKPVADMALRSVIMNKLEDCISIVNGDIKEASSYFGKASFDVVTCNPPYMDDSHGLKNPSEPKAIARHEVLCDFDDVAREAAACLRPGGRFYLVHRPRRIIDIIVKLREYKLEPKRMRYVHPFEDKEANMVLIEAVRLGKPLMHIEAPLVVYKDNNVYTDEVWDLYFK